MDRVEGKVLGVLGGMGPLASAQFMLRLTLLTPASRDQEHIPAAAMVRSARAGPPAGSSWRRPDPLPFCCAASPRLRAGGCGAIAIPCNTAHGWFDEMRRPPACPICTSSMRRRWSSDALGRTAGRIGVMGTAGDAGYAALRAGWSATRLGIVLDAATGGDEPRCFAGDRAESRAKCVVAAFAPLAETARSLAARRPRAVVLGCTEIPLGIPAGPADRLGVTLVDTIDALARAAIAWARTQVA